MPRGISRYDEAAFQGRLWTPERSDIQIAAWFDASDLSTITYGTSGISQWSDKSGKNNHATQTTDANRPTLTTYSLIQKTVISFSGTQSFSSGLSASSASESIFAVVQSSGGSTQTILGASSVGGRQFRIESSNELGFIRQNLANLAFSGAGNLFQTDKYTLIQLQYDGTTSQFYQNGNILGGPTTVSPSLTASLTTLIGQGASGVERWVGQIAEIISVQSVLSEKNRRTIEGYLSWKWDLLYLLSSSHPYISRPPTIGD